MAQNTVTVRINVEMDNLDSVRKNFEELGTALKKVGNGNSLDNLRQQLEAFDEHLVQAEAQNGKLSSSLKEQHGILDETASHTKLTGKEVFNLAQQLQGIAVQLAGGQNPLTVLAQQGPQVVDAVGGASRAISLLLSPLGAVTVAVGAVALGFGTVLARAIEMGAETRQLGVTLKTLNPTLNTSAEGLRAVSFAVAEQGTSRSTGMAALTAVIRDARIQSVGFAEEITKVSVDVAAVMGGDVVDWAKKLADAAATGSQGFDKLMGSLPGITAETMKAVRAAEMQGDRLGAAKIAVDALGQQYGGSAKQMKGAWDEALHDMTTAFDVFLERAAKSDFANTVARKLGVMGRAIAEALREDTDGEKVVALNKKLLQARDELAALEAMRQGKAGVSNPIAEVAARNQVAVLEQKVNAAIEEARSKVKAAEAAEDQIREKGATGAGATSQNPKGSLLGLTESDKNNLNLTAAATERQALASKLLSGALDVSSRAAVENRIALADLAMQYPGLGIAAANAILKSNDFSKTIEGFPELKSVWDQMQTNSANKLAGDMAQAGVALSSASNAARLNAEAAGKGEAAMRAASIEADIYAHRMDGTAGAVRKAREEQEIFARQQIHAEFAAGIDIEVAANDRLIKGMAGGAQAWRDAETYTAAYAQTLKEVPYPKAGESTDNWNKHLQDNIGLIEKQKQSLDSKAFAEYNEQLNTQTRQLQLQQSLIGATPQQAARLRVEYDINEKLLQQHRTYESLTDAEKKAIDEARSRAVANADLELSIARQKDAWDTLTGSLEKAFDQVGNSIADAFLKGQGEAIDWGEITKAVINDLRGDLLKLSIINPLKNAVFGTNAGTIFDLGGGASGNAAGQAGNPYGGLVNSASNWGMSKAGGWAMDKLGLGGGWDNLMSTPLWGVQGNAATSAQSLFSAGQSGSFVNGTWQTGMGGSCLLYTSPSPRD